MRGLSIRARLTIWYLGVLAVAMLTIAGASSWLFQRAVAAAADAALRERIASVSRFIEEAQGSLNPAELADELKEYGQLSAGEAFLEVSDTANRSIYRPAISEWPDLRAGWPAAAAIAFEERMSQGHPFRVAAATVRVRNSEFHLIAATPMGSLYGALRRFRWVLALLLPVIGALAAAGGFWLSRRALAPVDRMTRAVQAISLRSLDRRLDVPPTDDELRRLALTFNDMLARLQSSIADVVRFTADASHELRTPVSLVRTTAEVALAQPRASEDYRDALREILAHAERMTVLVGDLLALARADAGVEAPDEGVVDLGEAAGIAVRDVQPAARAKSQSLDLEVSGCAEVRGAAESLRRLMVILLDNAIKYTPPRGRVRLHVHRNGDAAVLLEVTDTGAGIDAVDRPHLFERFYRGARARAETDGSGLGLSLAQTIVERHGGTIAIDQTATGGCRVEVRLPAGPRPPARASHRPRHLS